MGIRIIRNKRRIKPMGMKGKIIIGIIGTHIGVGATHFSILLSNYMSECKGVKTAYIECFPSNEICHMEELYCLDGNATSTKESFSIYGIDYYKNVKEKKIAEIMGHGYDCIVFDLGKDINRMKTEFIRCDKKIVISNLAAWKYNQLENFLTRSGNLGANNLWEYGIAFTRKRDVKEMSRHYKIPMFNIPYEPDPFNLSIDTIQLFQKIT